MKTTTKSKVIIVDDHPVIRRGLVTLIESQPDMVVCGETGSEHTALQMAGATKPDVALVDISLGRANGLDLVNQLTKLRPPVPSLVLSMHDEQRYAVRALRAGARGYIMKCSAEHNIPVAIRSVLSGDIYLSETIKQQCLTQLVGDKANDVRDTTEMLSNREIDVLRRLGEGFSTKEIAAKMGVSPKTVETHRLHIKQKLGLTTHTQLVQYATRWIGDGI